MLLFSALGAMAMAGAADLMQLVMGVLLSSVTGYVLAAYHRDWAISVEAGMKYFLIGALANALMVIGVVLVLGMAGTTDYAGLARRHRRRDPLTPRARCWCSSGLLFKLGAVPAHAWVPDVAEGAPVPAAAFLTVVPKIAAAMALLRLVALVPAEPVALRLLVALLAAATMTLGNLAALWQDDVRRLIGWSSVGQAGYALMAVAVIGRSPRGRCPRSVGFVGVYALANVAAFAVVAHLRGRTGDRRLRRPGASRPAAATALTLVASCRWWASRRSPASSASSRCSSAAIDGGYAWLALVGVANSVLSLFPYARVIGPMAFGKPENLPQTLGGTSAAVMVLSALALVASAPLWGAFWASLPLLLLP